MQGKSGQDFIFELTQAAAHGSHPIIFYLIKKLYLQKLSKLLKMLPP